MQHRRLLMLIAAVVGSALPTPHHAAAQEVRWRTGAAFRRQLQLPVSFVWSQNPLRPALENLAHSQQIAIFLDRRVDPDQKVDLAVRQLPLEDALRQVAGHLGLAVGRLDPVVYLGPPPVASRLATVAAVQRERLVELPDAARRRWLAERPWQWDRLSTPRDLAGQLATEARAQLIEPQRIPHDLWPAVQLPPLPLADRLSLVLAGFSLSFELAPDGAALRLIEMPGDAVLVKQYPFPARSSTTLDELRALLPETAIRQLSDSWEIAGTYEEHTLVQRILQGETLVRRSAGPLEQRYRLQLENTAVGVILANLQRQLQLTVAIAPEAEPRLRQPVTVRLQDVTLEELLDNTLTPAGLQFRLQGQRLEVNLAR